MHGLSGSGTNWTDLAALLAPRATGWPLTCPASATPGRSRRGPHAAGHADALLCLLAGRGRPVHLVGNSFGGAIALPWRPGVPNLCVRSRWSRPRCPTSARPAPGVGPTADPRAPGPRGAAGSRRARHDDQPRPHRQVVRLCFGDPTLAPEHRLAEAAAEFDARSPCPGPTRRPTAPRRRCWQLGVGSRCGRWPAARAGPDVGGLGRPRPARRAPARRAHHAGGGRSAADAPRCGARRPDRGARGGRAGVAGMWDAVAARWEDAG